MKQEPADLESHKRTESSLADLLVAPSFTLNGRTFRNPLDVLASLGTNAATIDILRPRTNGFCVHGDMTFLNMVYDEESNRFRLIDNRG